VTEYCVKEAGETAMLRQMLAMLRPGYVLIADDYYGTYCLLAMCEARAVEVAMKNHHKGKINPSLSDRFVRDSGEVV